MSLFVPPSGVEAKPLPASRPVAFGQAMPAALAETGADQFVRSPKPVTFAGAYNTGFSFSSQPWTAAQADVLVVPVYAGKKHLALRGQLDQLNKALGESIDDLYLHNEFSGNSGETRVIRPRRGDGLGTPKIVLVGLGPKKTANPGQVAAAVSRALNEAASAKSVAVALPPATGKVSADAVIQAAVLAVDSLTYRSLEAIPGKGRDIETVTFLNPPEGGYSVEQFNAALHRTRVASRAVDLGKDLANMPYNRLNSAQFAQRAMALAARFPNVEVQVEGKEWVSQNMPAFYAVGKGANAVDPPQFIKLTYRSPGPVKNRVALLGKSIMYDTGGVQDKALHMNGMNKDMTGGAYAMGVIQALGELQPQGLEVSVYLPACANRDGAEAYLPSDILDSASGKKIEVGHTDAEGRVTLHDAAALAARDGFKKIISIATLTGDAIGRAPGQVCLVSSKENAALRDALKKAAAETGEDFREFPMEDRHFQANVCKHDNAHIRNLPNNRSVGDMEAGGAFIQAGLPDDARDIEFVHLDIAPVIAEGGMSDLESSATGKGLRTVLNYVLSQAK